MLFCCAIALVCCFVVFTRLKQHFKFPRINFELMIPKDSPSAWNQHNLRMRTFTNYLFKKVLISLKNNGWRVSLLSFLTITVDVRHETEEMRETQNIFLKLLGTMKNIINKRRAFSPILSPTCCFFLLKQSSTTCARRFSIITRNNQAVIHSEIGSLLDD